MSKRKLRLIIYIEPWGFSKGQAIRVIFNNKKSYVPNDSHPLCYLTRGEGQALQFVLEDSDTSCNFAEALRRGNFLEHVQNKELGRFEMRYVPSGKRLELVDEKPEDFMNDMKQNLADLDDALETALEDGTLTVRMESNVHVLEEHYPEIGKSDKLLPEVKGEEDVQQERSS